MSKWVVCKYPEIHGSEVGTLKVNSDKCLSCENTYCTTKQRVLRESFPPDVTEIPERGARVAKSGYCPLRPRAFSRCTAGSTYCKYNRVCPVADKYPKKTLVIHIAEEDGMYLVKRKKQPGPMEGYPGLREASSAFKDLNVVECVYEVTHKLVARMEFVPRRKDGETPKVKAVRGIENYTLIGSDGAPREYTDILKGEVSELFIATKEYVPALTLEKVPLDPPPRKAATAPATPRKKKK